MTYTYDPIYPRVLTMADGIGTTTYAYKAPGVLGAGQVASVDGPLTNDTITYTYDQLARVTVRAINGAANTATWVFDALGRVTSETNVLGGFTYTYDGTTSRLATVTYPNNQTSTYSYLPTNQDHRLQTIHHKYPGGATLSKFDYTYDAVGNILTWRQQADTTAVNWRYGYDAADQLTSAIKESTDPVPVIQKRYGYGYDPAGNRLFEQIDDQVMAASHDNLNRLTQHTPGGPLQFVGTVNETAKVTIAGQPATVDPTNTFRGPAPTVNGTTTVSITATDPSGNVANRQYEVDVIGTPKTITHDANGNMTDDGARTLEWDARNQLVAVNAGAQRSEFTYDGKKRLVRAVERTSGAVVDDARTIWCQDVECERRAADGSTVLRRTFRGGEQSAQQSLLFALDHLGSPAAVTDETGQLLARYEFGPWGDRTLISGSDVTDRSFTGHRRHSPSSLLMTWHRVYDPRTARWLSDDPLGIPGGINLAAYVGNSPVSWWDPDGEMRLPNNPSGLPSGWKKDDRHRPPHGEKWIGPNGDTAEWHKGQKGKTGNKGKDHWHWNGGKDHLPPGTEVPESPNPATPGPNAPAPTSSASCENCDKMMVAIPILMAAGYVAYKVAMACIAPPLLFVTP